MVWSAFSPESASKGKTRKVTEAASVKIITRAEQRAAGIITEAAERAREMTDRAKAQADEGSAKVYAKMRQRAEVELVKIIEETLKETSDKK